jgi:hypothetical protein
LLSSNHLIRPRQHVGRNRQADLLRCFKIDNELELLRLLYRQISGLSAFENLSKFLIDTEAGVASAGEPWTNLRPNNALKRLTVVINSAANLLLRQRALPLLSILLSSTAARP